MNSVAIPMRKNFKLKQVGFMMTAVLLLLLLQTLEITAQMMPNTFADLAEDSSPSVVNLSLIHI